MILGYFLRLLCLCAASFLLIHTAAAFAAWLFAPALIRRSASANPARSGRQLFALRMAPGALALVITATVCLPSYLWYEPASETEHIGFLGAAAALLGIILVAAALFRAARSIEKSVRYRCILGAQTSCGISPENRVVSAEIVDTQQPLVALSGIFRPRILISRGVLQSLSPAELEAALRHESAHHSSADNFKRLLLQLAPSAFPFNARLMSLERLWAKLSEWSADDFAVQGDPERRVALAAALVHVARMGTASQLAPLHSSLVAPGEDLAARVDRLLCADGPDEIPSEPRRSSRLVILFALSSIGISICLYSAGFQTVHSLLEILLHWPAMRMC